MLLLLFFLSFSSDICEAQQILYNGRMIPNEPRYFMQRPPARRSAMEALERLRMPVARYFPQMDSPVASGPYQLPSVPMTAYQLPADDAYAVPPQWTDEFVQQPLPERVEDDGDYENYEYENLFAPKYRPVVYNEDFYTQQGPIPEPESPEYNDLMINYFLGGSEPFETDVHPEQFDLQRRSEVPSNSYNNQGVVPLSNVLEVNKNATSEPSNVPLPATFAPVPPVPSEGLPQVQMTAVPSPPEKKEIKSLVIPEPVTQNREERGNVWQEGGQKEEPLFRPLQNSQRTTWDVLTRAKNSVEKRPIPLLKKMIQNSQQKKIVDPLTEELKNLRKEHSV